MRKVLGLLVFLVAVGCEDVRRLDPSPTLADQRKPKPKVELNTRGTPGRIFAEQDNPGSSAQPLPTFSTVPKEVTLTARFLMDEVEARDGVDDGSGMLSFRGTAVELDIQPYVDVSTSLYQGYIDVIAPDLEDCGFDYGQHTEISVTGDTVTWDWSGYAYSDHCSVWLDKALSGGVSLEVSNVQVPGGTVDLLRIELVP